MLRTILSNFTVALLALLLAFPSALAADQGDNPFQPSDDIMADVDKTLAAARENEKLALIVMGASWCHDSMGLYEHFKDAEMVEILAANYEMIFVDVGYLEHGRELIQRFGQPVIYGTPTVLIVDPETEELLNRESMHRLRDAYSMEIEDARSYFSGIAAAPVKEIDLAPSDPKLKALYDEIEAFENSQASRIYQGFAFLSPLLKEDEETGVRPEHFIDYWHELSTMRYTITGDLAELRAEARRRVAAGEENIELDYPEYPAFSWEQD